MYVVECIEQIVKYLLYMLLALLGYIMSTKEQHGGEDMADEKELSASMPQEPEWVQEAYIEDTPTKKPGKSPRKKTPRKSPRKVIGRTPIDGKSKSHHFTEMGNKERLYDLFGENIRYCKALGFVVWDTNKWVSDSADRVLAYATETIKSLYEEAANILLEASETNAEEERKRLAGI